MVRKKGKARHIPQRTCVGCRQVLSKRTLIRIVRSPDGVQVDPTGKMNGRGAYLHNQRSCWMKSLRGALGVALRKPLTEEELERLTAFAETLPDETTQESEPH